MALEAAGHRGEDGGHREHEPLPLERVHAHHRGRLLVVADRAHVRPDAGVHDLPRGENGRERQPEEQEVVRRGARRAEQKRRGQAEVAAGDLVLDGDEEPERLGEGPGGERQVDRAHSEAQRAEPVADRRGHQGTRHDPDQNRGTRVQDEQRRGVSAHAGEGVVRERELARVAGEQVPADGEHDVVEARDQHVGVVLGGGPRQPRERRVRQQAPADAADEARHDQAPSSESRMISRSWSANAWRGPSRRTRPISSM